MNVTLQYIYIVFIAKITGKLSHVNDSIQLKLGCYKYINGWAYLSSDDKGPFLFIIHKT